MWQRYWVERGEGPAMEKPVRAKAEGLAENHRHRAMDKPRRCPPSRSRSSKTAGLRNMHGYLDYS